MKRIIIGKAVVLAVVMSVAGAQPASAAYIDPATGGQLFQLLAVVFTFLSAILLFLSSYIRAGIARVKRFVRGASSNDIENEIEEQVVENVVSERTQQPSDAV